MSASHSPAPMAAGTIAPPPVAPGTLTKAPSGNDVLAYLDALGHWVTALRAALDGLDASAQVAVDPDAHTADITLAMSLWNSIDARRRELVDACDSGRVGSNELAVIATLIWGRLADPLGNPSAFTLPEACTLASALLARLQSALAGDAVAGSGAAARIAPLRAALERCLQHAEVLGLPNRRITELIAELEAVVAGANPGAIAVTVERIDVEVAGLERDLIKEAGARAGTAARVAELRRRYDQLATLAIAVRELARRCAEKILDAPRLGVPSVANLGEPPAPRPAGDVTDWDAARREVARYAEKLDRCAAALALAEERFSRPLQEREDLRGLLGAYRHRAADSGLAEDAALEDRYRAAHDVLFSAPCDLPAARALVAAYQHAVRVAVGADTAVESVAPAAPHPEET